MPLDGADVRNRNADAVEAMVHRLFPLAVLVTPNLQEAIALTGESDPGAQAQAVTPTVFWAVTAVMALMP